MNEVIKAEDFGIEEKKANELTIGLKVVKAERELLINEFKEVSKLELSKENLPKFKELRLRIVKNRTQGINKWHKTNKEFFLTGGKFVDAIKNKETLINEQMEEKLMDAEKHFENLEIERVNKLNNERIELVKPYLEETEHLHLSDMDQDVFEAFLLTKKNNYEAIIKAEKEREFERVAKEKAELERLEKQRLENIRLKKEAEAIRKEQAIKDAKIKAENDAKIKVEKEAREKLQAELKAKEDAEIKRIADNNARIIAEKKEAEAVLQNQLNKGDADKVKDLINDLEAIKTKYSFKSVKNKKMYIDTNLLIDKVINYISN